MWGLETSQKSKLPWYNCSPVCGSPTWLRYCRANGSLLQGDLCHMPCLPGLLLPVPLSPWQATADPHLHRKPSNTYRQVCLSLLWGHSFFPWVLVCARFGCACQESLAGMGFDFNMTAPLLPILLHLLLFLWRGISFFGGFQHPPVDRCSATSCKFGVLAEDEHMSFYSAILDDNYGLVSQLDI